MSIERRDGRVFTISRRAFYERVVLDEDRVSWLKHDGWFAVPDDVVIRTSSGWQLIDYDWNPDTGIATFLYSHETHGTRQVEREQRRYWHNQGAQ